MKKQKNKIKELINLKEEFEQRTEILYQEWMRLFIIELDLIKKEMYEKVKILK